MAERSSALRSTLRVLLFLGSCTVVLVLTSMLPVARAGAAQSLFIGAVAGAGSLALTVLFTRWDGLRLQDVGAMPNRGSAGRFAIGFVIGSSLVALHASVVGMFGHVQLIPTAQAGVAQAALVFSGYVLLAAREELAFHGYALRRLQNLFDVWPAQAMIAVVFAAEHVAGGWTYSQALWGAASGSLLFGMASIATRGLAVPIGIHAAWNFADWARGNRAEPGLWRPQVESGFEAAAPSIGIACYVLLMLLGTLGFWYWHRASQPVGRAA